MTEPAPFPIVMARRTLLSSFLIIWAGFSALFPLLGPLGRRVGMTELEITSIIGASSLCVFLMTPFWGRLSDRIGRKPVMLIGLFGFTFGTLIFNSILAAGLSGLLSGFTLYALLIASRLLHASVMSATMPAATAYMADITDTANRTKGMAATGAAGNIGSIIGPALATLTTISLLAPLWLMAFVTFVNALVLWRFMPEPRHHLPQTQPQAAGAAGAAVKARVRFTDKRILPFLIVGILIFTGFAMTQQTMGFRFQDALELTTAETTSTFGIAMMLMAVCSLLTQTFIVRRLSISPFALLRAAVPLIAISFLMIAITDTRLMFTIALMIQGIGMGLASPGFMAGASLAVGAGEQGGVSGIAAACPALGFFIGPMAGGALYQIDHELPYICATVLYVLLFLILSFQKR